MERLPEEMLCMILDALSPQELWVAARVCRRWERVAARRVMEVTRRADLERLAAAPHALVALQVSTHVDFLERLLLGVSRLCPQLRELTVHASSPLDARHVQMLRLLRLSHVDVFQAGGALDVALVDVTRHARRVVINDRVQFPLLYLLATITTALEGLHMYGHLVNFPPADLHAVLLLRNTHLRELTLRCMELTDDTVTLVAGCPNLVSLQLYSCWRFTLQGLLTLVCLEKLTKLHVTGLQKVYRRSMSRWLRRLPAGLVELNLSSTAFCDRHASLVVRRFPNLRVLELWKCMLTWRGVSLLARGLPHLWNLDLDVGLTDSQIEDIINNSSLEELRCARLPTVLTGVQSNGEDMKVRPESSARSDVDSDEVSAKQMKIDKDVNITETSKSDVKAESSVAGERRSLWRVGRARVLECRARYARKYFRCTEQGFRANLFYYSLQDVLLDPLPYEEEETCIS